MKNTKFNWENKGIGCYFCKWNASSCDFHHIKPVHKGGLDTQDNLVKICPNCHRLMHRVVIPFCESNFPEDVAYLSSIMTLHKLYGNLYEKEVVTDLDRYKILIEKSKGKPFTIKEVSVWLNVAPGTARKIMSLFIKKSLFKNSNKKRASIAKYILEDT